MQEIVGRLLLLKITILILRVARRPRKNNYVLKRFDLSYCGMGPVGIFSRCLYRSVEGNGLTLG